MEEAKAEAGRFARAYGGAIASGRVRGEALAAALQELEEILLEGRRMAFYASLLVAADTRAAAALDPD